MKQQKRVSAQYLIDHCEKHGVIKWKQMHELVNQDRVLGAKKGEWKQWKKKDA
jgi:hypothetical protein